MKKAISLLLLLAIIFMPAKAQDVENVKPVKNVILLIPGRDIAGNCFHGALAAMVYQPRQTEIEHRPVSLADSPHTFFECTYRRLGPYDFLLHDRTAQPYRLRFHLSGERRRQRYLPDRSGTCFPTADNRPGSGQDKTGQIDGTGFHLRIPACDTGRLFRPQLQPWQI